MRGSVTGKKPRVFVQVGQRFGKLTVTGLDARIGVSPSKPAGWRAAICLCDCGTEVTVAVSNLASGRNRSCGCLKRELIRRPEMRANNTIHGLATHPLYEVWYQMLRRCENPRARNYHLYGGRGVKVCERWHDVRLFIEDIEREIGPRPEGRTPGGMPVWTLDRKDNASDYGPGKVRWATAGEQQRNKRTQAEADADWIDFYLESKGS